jgi:hypothetical protein
MGEIPADVMELADEAWNQLAQLNWPRRKDETETIARIIMADRGRASGRITQMVQLPADALRLQYGEMTAGEVRTVRAVLTHFAATIRGDA